MRPFRFAVQAYQAPSAAEWVRLARRAEQLGYSTLHLADHVIGPGPALTPTNHPVQDLAAVPAMMAAACATTSLRVGCRVLCVDYRYPVMLAKELATIDLLSEGRLEIGLGAGWLANEYKAMGIPLDPAGVRIDRLVEVVHLLDASFADGELAIDGRHVHAVGFEAVPKPVQRPRPPIMIGGGAQRVLRTAASLADIVSLNFNNASGRIGPEGVGSSTAALTERKIGWIRDAAGDRFEQLEIEVGAYFTFVTDDRAALLDQMAGRFGMSADELAEHPHALIGSVGEIADQLVARRERFGISYVTVGVAAMEAFAPVVERLAGT